MECITRTQRDGYSYPTVSIGEQCWMAENLRYVSPGSSEVSIPAGGVASQLDDGFVYTGIDDYDIVGNGRYYSWSSAAGAVPYAWHLPTAEEFQALLLNHNGIDLQVDGVTGFDAQMSGGVIMPTGEIEYVFYGNSSFLWTSTELDQDNASAIEIVDDIVGVNLNPLPKEFGISIRALFGFLKMLYWVVQMKIMLNIILKPIMMMVHVKLLLLMVVPIKRL